MRHPTAAPDGAGNLCVAIVETVADNEGVAPTELTVPLHEVVDIDALELLFAPTVGDGERYGRAAFEYYGYRVVVDSDRQVSVAPLGEVSAER